MGGSWKERRIGISGDEQHSLLQEHAIASSDGPSTSSWIPFKRTLSEPYPLENCSSPLMASSESLLDQEAHIWDNTLHYSRTSSLVSLFQGCQVFGVLARFLIRLTKYLQLQLVHRFGITIAIPGTPLILSRQFSWRSTRTLTYTIWCLYAFLFIVVLFLFAVILYGGVPPSYSAIRAAEYALPQHHWDSNRWNKSGWRERQVGNLARGDAEELYLRFPDHLWGHGLNNVLQEAILTNHLTLTSNRTPVFEDYTWSRLPLQYTLYDFSLRPTRIPLGAFIGGVLGGQDSARYGADSSTKERRAVSAAYFDYVCPPKDVVEVVYRWPGETIDTVGKFRGEKHFEGEMAGTAGLGTRSSLLAASSDKSSVQSMSFPSLDADGTEIIDWFSKRLSQPDVRDKRCVVIREERRVFDSDFFGSSKIISLLPDLLASPVLKKFEWSKLVRGAVEKIVDRFSPTCPELDAAPSPTGANHTLPGVLALHLRRGDYKRHCTRLKNWASGYMGVMDMLSDRFDPENGRPRELMAHDNETDSEDEFREARREAYYLQHCLPDVRQVVERLREVRNEYDYSWYQDAQQTLNKEQGSERRTPSEAGELGEMDIRIPANKHRLRHVYVLTNGWPSFLEELRLTLMEDGWESVVGTPDWGNTVPALPFRIMDGTGDAHLNSEERGVSAAVDMEIAQRAEVFVGNGFSSLSSNVVMMRLANTHAVYANRVL